MGHIVSVVTFRFVTVAPTQPETTQKLMDMAVSQHDFMRTGYMVFSSKRTQFKS